MIGATERMNPFPGLRPFELGEEHLFFGREDRTDELLARLHQHRFVAIVGQSGSGKSSLIQAGLLPALYSGFLPETSSRWRLAYVGPGANPIHSLAAALARSLDPRGDRPRTTNTRTGQAGNRDPQDLAAGGELQAQTVGIEATLRRGRLGLIEAIRQFQLQPQESALVVVDGLETWFGQEDLPSLGTTNDSGARSKLNADREAILPAINLTGRSHQEDEVAAFVKLLLAAVQQHQQPIYVAISLRSDFVGDCARFAGLPEAINRSQYLMSRMTREQRRTAIEGPIGVVGGAIAPQLVQRMLNDMGESVEPLPTMQHALMRTWDYWLGHHDPDEPVDLQHYKAVGGISAALPKHADRIYTQLTKQQQAIAQRMFQLLTQRRADKRDMRRAATLKDIARVAQVSQDEVRGVVNRFRGRHNSFLLPPQPEPLLGSTVLTISHESLMRAWPRLANWMRQEEESANEYCQLAEAASRYWLGGGKLLQEPELTLALRWQQHRQPNVAWAERYRDGFGDTIHFLELSRKARDREAGLQASAAAEQDRLRKRHFKQMVGAAAGMATLTGVAILGIVLTGFRISAANRARQQATNAEIDARISASQSLQQAGQELAGAVEALTAGRQLQASNGDSEPSLAMQVAAHLRETVDGETGGNGFDAQSGALYNASFSPDGQTLVSAGEDATIKVWSLEGEALSTLRGRGELSSRVSFHPDGSEIAAASSDGTIDIWTLQGELVSTFQGHEGAVRDISFSPDGDTLASAGDDATVRMWDIDGDSLVNLRGHEGTVLNIAFSPKGDTIASAGTDSTVRLWSLEGEELLVLQGHEAGVNDVSFSSDGRTLASASDDGTVRVWTGDGEKIASLQGHDGTVTSVEFGPDGQTLVSTGTDGTSILWNALDAMQISTLRGHKGAVFSASFSPDGHTLASAGEDGTVRVWNFELEGLLARGCQKIAGDLQALSGTDLGQQAVCDAEPIATSSAGETADERSAVSNQTLPSLPGSNSSGDRTITEGSSSERPEPDESAAPLPAADRSELDSESELDGNSVSDDEPINSAEAEVDESEAGTPESTVAEQADDTSEIAAAETEAPIATAQPSIPRGRVTWPEGLVMLSAPAGTNIGGVAFNEIVAILEVSSNGRWQRVRRESDGQEGWIKAGNLATLPDVDRASVEGVDVEDGEPTEARGEGETESADAVEESDSNSTDVAAASPPTGDRGRVIWPSGLAIRPEPRDGIRQIDGIPFNEVVTILESSEDGRWQRVRRDATGIEGWVKAGNIAALTTSPNSPESLATPSASYRGRVIWRQGLAIRVEPRNRATQIDGVPYSEVVTILSTSSDGRWLRVRRDLTGTVGWVKAGNIVPVR